MALSVKTERADRLARELTALTGETITEAVEKSLAERLERQRRARDAIDPLRARAERAQARFDAGYDKRPISREKWDAAVGGGE